MKPFHTIAVPHKDILEGQLDIHTFAADLWKVQQNKGPEEYRDADIFFKKTYQTKGLKNLFDVVSNRLSGKKGDPVIQLQTPFGGGKTHALIALFHKAEELGAKKIVIEGTALNPKKDTLWGIIEKQLTGKIIKFNDNMPPGKDDMAKLLEKHQPLLILMDEVLQYTTKAAGVIVGDSTLASQTIAFMQEFTELISSLSKVSLVVTLPSSRLEHYDKKAEEMFTVLEKVMGRLEKIYTPVEEHEITSVVRKRLFSDINSSESKTIISNVVNYFKKEDILPVGIEVSDYRKRFISSYPFLPDVIDNLYHRWGSFPNFQRTRGVLRFMSLIIHNLKESNIEYITLADIDLLNQEIRRELIKHIGNEYDSIIDADLGNNSRKVDHLLRESYRGLKLGTKTSTTIFMASFSAGQEKGATIKEIKRSVSSITIPSSTISEVVNLIQDNLFYINNEDSKLFFTNVPGLNKILIQKMENIDLSDIKEMEKNEIENMIKKSIIKTYLWPLDSNDILDNQEIKLVILSEHNEELMKYIIENKGNLPRVYKNTIVFLVPLAIKKDDLFESIRRTIGYEYIQKDKTLKLSDDQKSDVKNNIKKESEKISTNIRESYRNIYVLNKDYEFSLFDLGIYTLGMKENLAHEVFERLKEEGLIIEKIAPIALIHKYLKDKKYVSTKKIYESSLTTPGENRFFKVATLDTCIMNGVINGHFGLGEISLDNIELLYWKKEPIVGYGDSEAIIEKSICEELSTIDKPIKSITNDLKNLEKDESKTNDTKLVTKDKQILIQDIEEEFLIPKGQIQQLYLLFSYLQEKFDTLKIRIYATNGAITINEFEDNIKEAIKQLENF